MARILVIEDTDIQRQHAERELEGHDLTFATTAAEVEDMGQYDFILTDLFLPESAGGEPDFEVGRRLLEKAFKFYERGEVKGVALVSNYDHHVDVGTMSRNDRLDLRNHLKEKNFFDYGWHIIDSQLPEGVSDAQDYFEYRSSESVPSPLLYILDALVEEYEHYMTAGGDVISYKEFRSRIGDDPSISELYGALRGEFNIAKPWGKVVESLEYLQD